MVRSALALRRTLSYREALLGVRSLDEAGRLHFAEHSWHHSGMLAPSQRTRRFFDAHVAPHLTLTAADATREPEPILRPRAAPPSSPTVSYLFLSPPSRGQLL